MTIASILNIPKGHPDQQFGSVTYAQHGDDLMILNLFQLIGIEPSKSPWRPNWLDLGAHDPFVISNTALLYSRGFRGVNVEANPELIKRFQVHRPEDLNINVGVGVLSGTAHFYKYSDTSGRNTFSIDEVRSLEGRMTVRETVVLPVKTLQTIVHEHCGGLYPDLLSCDIEGLDYDVLSQLPKCGDLNSPKIVVVETRRHDTERMGRMMRGKGYVPHCRMGENLFFVRADLLDRLF